MINEEVNFAIVLPSAKQQGTHLQPDNLEEVAPIVEQNYIRSQHNIQEVVPVQS
jgi:hypothetical protein